MGVGLRGAQPCGPPSTAYQEYLQPAGALEQPVPRTSVIDENLSLAWCKKRFKNGCAPVLLAKTSSRRRLKTSN